MAAPRRWIVTGTRIEKLDGLDDAMQRLMQPHQVRSGALAVAREGEVLFERGYTSAEEGDPVAQPSSPFRLASVSKAFTAALIHELIERGALSLDAAAFIARFMVGEPLRFVPGTQERYSTFGYVML